MRLQFRMSSDVLLCRFYDLALAFVAELGGSVVERDPEGALDLNPHFGRDVAEFAGAIQKKVEADDFEDARLIAPVAHIDVLDVGEFGDEIGANAGLFFDLTQGGLLRLLA